MNYFENLNETVKEYFNILSNNDIPSFLNEYINTKEMQRIGGISALIGADYTNLTKNEFFYSSLDHSVGVALIIWNFTKDKKQTLAGLFHDIATPVFKHAIDFLNEDYEKQESTEELTYEIIQNSKEITMLLKRDNIKLEEVVDYKIYPIADNETPQLSADRLEYTFSDLLEYTFLGSISLEEIRKTYKDIKILKNERQEIELGFKTSEIAEEFIEKASRLWYYLQSNLDKVKTQFLADIVKKMNEINLIHKEDLYRLSEKEAIKMIEECPNKNISKAFCKFAKAEEIGESSERQEDKYCISLKVKRRYIVPLVEKENTAVRITKLSDQANKIVDDYLKYNSPKYGYLDFKF